MRDMLCGASTRRSFFLILSLVTAGGFAAITFLPIDAAAATLYVGGVGPGNFTTIQAAVDAAAPGDIIYVYPGRYHEQVTVPKPLTLVGEDRETTVIDGDRIGDVVRLTANWVNITGFKITNSSYALGDAALELSNVQRGRVYGNNVSDNWGMGIYLVSSWYNVIENNTLLENIDPDGAGVLLSSSSYNLIANNTASGGADGFALQFSDHNVVLQNNASTNWDYGISLSTSNQNRIENNVLFDNWGRGVVVASSSANAIRDNTLIENYRGIQLQSGSSGNAVTGNLFSNTWDYGIYLYVTSGNRVSNNTLMDTGWTGVEVAGASAETIDNNTILGSRNADIVLGSSVGISIADNTMERGIIVSYSTFSGNSLSHWNTHDIPTSNLVRGKPVQYWKNVTGGAVPPGAGQVILANTTGVTVANQTFDDVVVGVETGFCAGNTVYNVTGRDNVYGVILGASTNSLVQNVSFANASQFGAHVRLSDLNTIRNSSFPNAALSGLRMENSDGNTIVSVNASGGTGTGVYLSYAGNTVISNSTFMGNAGSGAYLSYSADNTLSSSSLANNTLDGLYLTNSNNNSVLGNLLAWNGRRGANVSNSDANRVYHNDFIGNGGQASDNRANGWDDGYPSGGNFWSDYTGADVFSGPDQDVPGSDGIGDDPYVIDADSADRYPLMTPFTLDDALPPTVSISYPTEGLAVTGAQISVQGNASDAGGSGVQRVDARVNGGPWQPALGTAVWSVVVDLALGPNLVEAMAWDRAANPSAVATVNVTRELPPNTPPSVGLTVTPPSGNLATLFTAAASPCTDAEDPSSVLEVRWDWQDDGTWDSAFSTTKTASHQYTALGSYTIRVEVRDTGGLTDQATETIWVNNTPPMASFTVSPSSGDVTTLLAVDASGSSDLEDPSTALEVRWDWRDDGTWDTLWSTMKIETHRFAVPGTYTIRLEVRDSSLLSDQATRSVWVNNTAPIAAFTATPSVGDVSTVFTFDASGSSDLEDPGPSLEVRWDWEDDGAWDTAFSPAKTAQHRYSSVGDHTARLEVRDSGGLSSQATRQVGILNTAPVAAATAVESVGNVSTQFSFDASASSDLEDPTSALEVRWDWEDDGTWDTSWSPTKTATHSYPTPRSYTVRLAVRDTLGLIGETTHSVVVLNTAPTASLTVSPSEGVVGTAFRFDASAVADLEDSSSALEVRWDWEGDGVWDTAWSLNKTAEHSFPSPGTYTVRVQVRDTGGLTTTATVDVEVLPEVTPPTEFPVWIVPAILVPIGVLLGGAFLWRRRRRKVSAQESIEADRDDGDDR